MEREKHRGKGNIGREEKKERWKGNYKETYSRRRKQIGERDEEETRNSVCKYDRSRIPGTKQRGAKKTEREPKKKGWNQRGRRHSVCVNIRSALREVELFYVCK